MNMNQYINELNSIQASDSLKLKLKELANNPAIVYHKPKQSISKIKILSFAAMFLLVVVTVPTIIHLKNSNINNNGYPSSTKLESKSIMGVIPQDNQDKIESLEETSSVEEEPYSEPTINPNKLPILTTYATDFGGFGFEGLMAYTVDELIPANPWNTSYHLKALPVFKNNAKADPVGFSLLGLSDEELQQTTEKIIKNLSEEPVHYTKKYCKDVVREGYKDDDYYELIATNKDVEVTVNRMGEISIHFANGYSLPTQFSFSNKKTFQENRTTLKYLYSKFNNILNFSIAGYSIDKQYSFNGDPMVTLETFEIKGNIVEKMLGYNFNNATFLFNESGKLDYIHIQKKDISNKVGDYPIINVDEATQQLIEGKYLTTVPEEFNGDKNLIEHVELVYRTQNYNDYFMPYYRFYVNVPSMKEDNGLNCYGMYYVPAVEPRFMKSMPQPDMRFN